MQGGVSVLGQSPPTPGPSRGINGSNTSTPSNPLVTALNAAAYAGATGTSGNAMVHPGGAVRGGNAARAPVVVPAGLHHAAPGTTSPGNASSSQLSLVFDPAWRDSHKGAAFGFALLPRHHVGSPGSMASSM